MLTSIINFEVSIPDHEDTERSYVESTKTTLVIFGFSLVMQIVEKAASCTEVSVTDGIRGNACWLELS